jgi:oligopeptidase B
VTLLPYQVYRHVLGTPATDDVLVYEESDDTYWTSVYASRSDRFIVISISSTESSEVRLVDADEPTVPPRVLLPRQVGHEYRIRHKPGYFYILTNSGAENFRLVRTSESSVSDASAWEEIVPHRPDVLITDFEVFNDYTVVNETLEGLPRLRVIDQKDGDSRSIEFPDPAYTARLHSNPEIESSMLRYVYSSLTTPESVFEFDMERGESRLLKRDPVLGNFEPSMYRSERLDIDARDGTRVPVSLVYRADLEPDGENPIYVYGYGSYGLSVDPSFSSLRLPLLDRGFVYAIVHVRGGQELGRDWYEQGRMLNKRNTFNDFVDATRGLVEKGYGHRDEVIAAGGSAGGLLMGVIANEAPELYRGIIANVPFVDVVTTMLDESIPLVTGEFSEWGDPRDKRFYDYMLAYSPYDQVKAQDYPNMLVTTGLWDSQVQYYEPVKWVKKLRKHKTDDNLLLLHVDMSTGHSGASGRYQRYRLDGGT